MKVYVVHMVYLGDDRSIACYMHKDDAIEHIVNFLKDQMCFYYEIRAKMEYQFTKSEDKKGLVEIKASNNDLNEHIEIYYTEHKLN